MVAMARIRSLHVYPVKACAGVSPDAARIDARGLEGDRRWMVVDAAGRFLTQRTHPALARVRAQPLPDGGVTLGFAGLPDLRLRPATLPRHRRVRIWQDEVEAQVAGDEAGEWLSAAIGAPAGLVFADEATVRAPDPRWTGSAPAPVAFPDGFPVLVCSTSSLEALGRWMGETPPMACFRPNVVIEGWPAWAEDALTELRCGEVTLRLVKPCTRCVVTTLDPATGEPGANPLPALREHRYDPALKGVTFGQNALVLAPPGAVLRVGDGVEAA
jgi:uncharacterized protein YcbX